MYGYWRKPEIAPTAFGQAMAQSELYDPTTSAVTRTFAEEATIGVGTAAADISALQVKMAEESGTKITEEEYKNNPEFYSQGQSWYPEMTRESAKISKAFNDAAVKRAQIISDASTGQAILGFGAGFAAGVVEPKNLAIGVGVSLAAGPLGTAGYLGNRARMAYQLAKTSTRARVAIGAGEGVVAAAIAEPTNRYSAKTLQQDYTMMDSAFNVLTSTAFGAAVPAASGFIKGKIEKFRGRTMDVVAAEVDLATQQLELGQRVDVRAIEAAEIGNLADAPVVKQAQAAEKFMRFVESPEFKSRFEGSKVVDETGRPMMVYHGTDKQFDAFDISKAGQRDAGWMGEAIYLTGDPKLASNYASMSGEMDISGVREGANVRPSYVKIEKPYITDNALLSKSFVKQLREDGYDGILAYKQVFDGEGVGKPNEVAVFSPDQIIPAFGEKSLSDIIAQAESQNTTAIAKHNAQALDHRNDTLIDYDAIDALDERKAIMESEAAADAEAYYQQAEAEIRQMLDEGTMNEADLEDYRKILEDLNDSKKTTDALETLKLCLTGL